jgi:uncharacterized damage-inducible protein DinB
MNVAESLTRQLAHASWANSAYLAALQEIATPPARTVRWIAHVLAAEELWQERLLQSGRSVVVWPEHSIAECHAIASRTTQRWREMLRELQPESLATPIRYANSKGEAWENSVHDILVHVCLHGSYHRGQIATALREAGFDPPYTDYIHAVRQELIA